MAGVGSVISCLKCSVFNNAIHFSVYLVISNITTPLPLSCNIRHIEFTYEIENDGKLHFLDVLVNACKNYKVETTVYRKSTNNNIYLHWQLFSPTTWK